MKKCIQFCIKNKLVLLADEVYQDNIYVDTKKFISFRKVALDMGDEGKDLQLISFHSVSKGYFGECGRRGGYMQVMGFDEEVKAQIFKLLSINLCSNIDGQIALDILVKPPKEGEPSYELFEKEKHAILDSLKRRRTKLCDALSQLPGISCNVADGSMYVFFKVEIPKAVEEEAAKRGITADYFYCEALLNETGIVTVPGSGFHQVAGTHHVRTTFLPPEDQMDTVISRMTVFQKEFMSKYNYACLFKRHFFYVTG